MCDECPLNHEGTKSDHLSCVLIHRQKALENFVQFYSLVALLFVTLQQLFTPKIVTLSKIS